MEPELDPLDIGILQLLQTNARLSNKEIAHILHRSVTPIHRRIKQLQTNGYIVRFSAILNREKIKRSLIGYIHVHLKEHSQKTLEEFQKEVIDLPEVMECYQMAGDFDFLLKIAINDMKEYNELLMKKLLKLPYVGTTQSFFAMSEIKNETAFPLNDLLGA